MKYFKEIVTACLMCTVLTANAAIIEIGNYQRINGLDWLDLTETDGKSYTEVQNEFSGWTLANQAQYTAMFKEFDTVGDDLIGNIFSTNIVNFTDGGYERLDADTLISTTFSFGDIFGYTRPGDEYASVSQGWYDDGDNQATGGITVDLNPAEGTSYIRSFYDYSIYGSTDGTYSQTNFNKGWFLVRETGSNGIPSASAVPEPSIVALLGLGILSIGVTRRRKT